MTKDVLSILNEIKEEPSTNAKLLILESHKDNKTLKEAIRLSVDQSLQSGVKKIPEVMRTDDSDMSLDEALESMNELYAGKITGNAARSFIGDMLTKLSTSDSLVLERVITKTLDCGLQAKNINKVFGKDFIPVEPYMRCSLTTTDTLKNITSFQTHGYAVSEVKMDGQYLNHVIRGLNYTSTSRNGIIFDFLGERDDEMQRLAQAVQESDTRFSSGVVFQGECLMLDQFGNIMDRKSGNGIIQKASKGTMTQEEAQRVVFVLWDVLPYDAFRAGIWNVKRQERRNIIEAALSKCSTHHVRMIKYKKVRDIREAFLYNAEMMGEGEEGTVLKCEDGIWKSHTSPKQLKMKMRVEIDLKIVGFNVSTKGKRKNILGSIMCESSDGIIKVNVGSGFKEKDDRWTTQSIWDEQEDLLGKIITVESSGITQDKKTLEYSLFIPTFVEFRFDKNTCDSFERIQEIEKSYVDMILAKLEMEK